MSRMSSRAAERLGHELAEMGFRPLPEVDDDGRLRGVRLWRPRPGMLEYLSLRTSGLATAGRVVDHYDYRTPFEHGPVVDIRRGSPTNALRWLLADMDLETTQPIPVGSLEGVISGTFPVR